jgi:hypothetical protein
MIRLIHDVEESLIAASLASKKFRTSAIFDPAQCVVVAKKKEDCSVLPDAGHEQKESILQNSILAENVLIIFQLFLSNFYPKSTYVFIFREFSDNKLGFIGVKSH